jgi:hypothetical protein
VPCSGTRHATGQGAGRSQRREGVNGSRYYLYYCHKYQLYALSPASLPSFLNKPKEKKQPGTQQKQANEATHLFYALVSQHPNIKQILASNEQQNHGIKDIGTNLKPEI